MSRFTPRHYHKVSQKAESDSEDDQVALYTAPANNKDGHFGMGGLDQPTEFDFPRIHRKEVKESRLLFVCVNLVCIASLTITLAIAIALIVVGQMRYGLLQSRPTEFVHGVSTADHEIPIAPTKVQKGTIDVQETLQVHNEPKSTPTMVISQIVHSTPAVDINDVTKTVHGMPTTDIPRSQNLTSTMTMQRETTTTPMMEETTSSNDVPTMAVYSTATTTMDIHSTTVAINDETMDIPTINSTTVNDETMDIHSTTTVNDKTVDIPTIYSASMVLSHKTIDMQRVQSTKATAFHNETVDTLTIYNTTMVIPKINSTTVVTQNETITIHVTTMVVQESPKPDTVGVKKTGTNEMKAVVQDDPTVVITTDEDKPATQGHTHHNSLKHRKKHRHRLRGNH